MHEARGQGWIAGAAVSGALGWKRGLGCFDWRSALWRRWLGTSERGWRGSLEGFYAAWLRPWVRRWCWRGYAGLYERLRWKRWGCCGTFAAAAAPSATAAAAFFLSGVG